MTGKSPLPAVPEGRGTAIGYLAAVLLLPLLVLWSQDNPLFTGYGYIDPWVYFGYFRNLVEFKRNLFFGSSYGANQSWILPGAALHTLFAPVTATSLLHLGVHTLATTSLFLTLKWVAGARRAFVTAMVFCVNPWLWAATGWDYVDGIGIAYCLLSMALLTWAARDSEGRWALAAAGMTLAALLYTGAGWLTLAPLLPLYYIGLMRAWHQAPISRSFFTLCIWFGAGCAIAIVFFRAVNYFLEGYSFLYASPVREVVSRYASQPRFWLAIMAMLIALAVLLWARRSVSRAISAPVLSSLLGLGVLAWIIYALVLHDDGSLRPRWEGLWWNDALSSWLLFPAIAVVTAVVVLFSGRRASGRIPALFSIQLLCAFAWMTYAQLRGHPELGTFYFASKLLPFSFLVIGAQFWPGVEKVRTQEYLVFCCVAALVLGYAWLGEGASLVAQLPYAAWVGAAGLLLPLFWRQFPEYLICTLGGFFVLTGVAARYGGIDAHAYRDQLQALSSARERIEAVRQGRLVRFWYDDKDPAMPDALALTTTYLGDESLLSRHFPIPPCEADLLPSTLVAVISASASQPSDRGVSALSGCWSNKGLRAVLVESEAFQHGSSRYQMSLLRVEVAPAAWQAMVPVFDQGSRPILREAAASSVPSEFPARYWEIQPGDDTAGLLARADGVIVRTHAVPNSVAALYPALSAPVAGRYRFALRYQRGPGSFRFGVYVPDRANPWLGSSSKGDWAGSDYEMACWVDLTAGQEFQLALVNNSDDGRPASLLMKSVTAVRIASERAAP